jgi:hypothetical protein
VESKVRAILLALFVAALPSSAAVAQATPILIFGGTDHREFLGCVNCDELDDASVWNDISQYGWHNSIGKWSDVGEYGSSIGSYSACNDLSSDPPVLVDRRGNFYGRLSTNELVSGSVCGITGGNEKLCMGLKAMCTQH